MLRMLSCSSADCNRERYKYSFWWDDCIERTQREWTYIFVFCVSLIDSSGSDYMGKLSLSLLYMFSVNLYIRHLSFMIKRDSTNLHYVVTRMITSDQLGYFLETTYIHKFTHCGTVDKKESAFLSLPTNLPTQGGCITITVLPYGYGFISLIIDRSIFFQCSIIYDFGNER